MAQNPHVLIFPFPVQGHINCMLKLAELLCCRGLHVTFLNSHDIHERLLCCTDIHHHFNQYPNFHFDTISDGLPADHPRTGDRVVELFHSINAITKPQFRDLLIGLHNKRNGRPPVTCIIADGIMSFTVDVAKELEIPTILFRTVSASCFWAFLCVPKLLEAGLLPLNAESSMDRLLSSMPGLENFRLRDLPSFCRTSNLADPGFQVVISETLQNLKADGLLLNTFEEIEGTALSNIRSHMPNLYTVGPLHAHLKARAVSNAAAFQRSSSTSLWEEDRSCMAWLDRKPLNSVVYVSFGSMTVLTRNQLFEFWHGLVNSGKNFLWVIRPKSVHADGNIPAELLEGTRKRGYMVGWAPQQEVLAHPAVGGFLTHSGWNSTLESLYEGVPMICWPFYADQQVNSRLVGEVWKVGLDMKDTCDRAMVEKMIGDLMEARRDEFIKCSKEKAKWARRSVEQGGTSYCNLERLIEDIKLMSCANQNFSV